MFIETDSALITSEESCRELRQLSSEKSEKEVREL